MTKKSDVSQMPDKAETGKHEHHPNPASTSPRRGDDFGLEGTNKTVPVPQPDAEPAEELQGTKTKFVPKSPYTRG